MKHEKWDSLVNASEQAEADIAQFCHKKARPASDSEDGGEEDSSVGKELAGYDVAHADCKWLLCFHKTQLCYSLRREQLDNSVHEQKQSRQLKTNHSYAYAHKKFYVRDYLQAVLMPSTLTKLWLCSGTVSIMVEKVPLRLKQYAICRLITA